MRVMFCCNWQTKMLNYFKQNFAKENERWVLWTPVLFGIGIGLYFVLPFDVPSIVLVLLIEFVLLFIYLARYKQDCFLILTSLFIVLFGFSYIKLYTIYQAKSVSFPLKEETTYIKGVAWRVDKLEKNKQRLWLKNVEDFENKRTGIYRISVRQKANIETGTCIEAVASITSPSDFLGSKDFDFGRYAFYQGISAIGYAKSSVFEIECEDHHSFFTKISSKINKIRKSISRYISSILPSSEAAVASAVLVGDKALLSDDLYRQYRDAGLAHFLAISGLHMGFIAAFAFFFVRFLFALTGYLALHYSSKKVAAVFAIALTFIYLLLSGSSVPAVRAFVMTSIVFIGICYDRNAISMRTVAFAALVILIFEPYVILSASFQMSFSAVVALIAFYEWIENKINLRANKKNLFSRIFFYFLGVMMTSLIATLATLPFALYHFGTFAPYTLLGNILAAPVIAFVIMPFIFLSLLFLPFHIAAPFIKISGYGLMCLNKITAYVSGLPSASIKAQHLPLSALILVTLGGLWLCLWQKKWRLWGISFILLGFLIYAFAFQNDILYQAKTSAVGIKSWDK